MLRNLGAGAVPSPESLCRLANREVASAAVPLPEATAEERSTRLCAAHSRAPGVASTSAAAPQ